MLKKHRAVGCQEEHLRLPTIGIEWPAVAEDDGLPRAPVLVIDLRAVFRCNRAPLFCLLFHLVTWVGQS